MVKEKLVVYDKKNFEKLKAEGSDLELMVCDVVPKMVDGCWLEKPCKQQYAINQYVVCPTDIYNKCKYNSKKKRVD